MKYNFLLIIILLIIIFLLLNKMINRKEKFLTYFIPFVNEENNKYLKKLDFFYDQENYRKNYFKNYFNFELINFGSKSIEDDEFIKIFMDIFIKETNFYQIKNSVYKNNISLLQDLQDNKINIGNTYKNHPILCSLPDYLFFDDTLVLELLKNSPRFINKDQKGTGNA